MKIIKAMRELVRHPVQGVVQFLNRSFCWMRGHDVHPQFSITNTDSGGRSDWGRNVCWRCGHEEDWQYDRR